MSSEVLLRVGSNPDVAGWQDGMPIDVKPSGVSWTPAEVNQWVNNGTEPANLTDLPDHLQQTWRRWRRITNYVINGNGGVWDPVDAAQRYFDLGAGAPTPAQLEAVNGIRDATLATRDELLANDFLDSNWGYEELRRFVILPMDLDVAAISQFINSPVDLSGEAFSPRNSVTRRAAIVDWRNLPGVGAGIIALIEDPAQILTPAQFRTRLYTRAEVAAVTTIIRETADIP